MASAPLPAAINAPGPLSPPDIIFCVFVPMADPEIANAKSSKGLASSKSATKSNPFSPTFASIRAVRASLVVFKSDSVKIPFLFKY